MKNFIVSVFFFGISYLSWGQGEFITVWDLSKPGAQSTQIRFLTSSPSPMSINFEWEEISPGNAFGSGSLLNTLSVYNLQIIGGLPQGALIRVKLSISNPVINVRFAINNGTDRLRLIGIEQWGTMSFSGSQGTQFNGCENLNITATDTPMLGGNLVNMFRNCSSLTGPGNINSWNTTNVTNMMSMFEGATSFNQPISSWNTSNVGNMSSMFKNAVAFNQSIGSWNTSNVSSMSSMFEGATSFNQNLESWSVANVLNMNNMFSHAEVFNHALGNWILNPNVTMNDMLNFCGLDCDNYSQTLTGWQQNNPTVYNKTLGAIPLGHNADAQTAKIILNNQQGWNIQDAGFGFCHAFETIWDLSLPGASNNTISFTANYVAASSGSYEWESIPAGFSGSGNWTSTSPLKFISGLPPSGMIKLKMSTQTLKYIKFINKTQLIAVTQWGNAAWSSMSDAFKNCSNLEILATDIPNLVGCSNFQNMFSGCTSISNIPYIESWNTSNIIIMESMFENSSGFNQNLGLWALNPNVNLQNMFNGSSLDCFNYASTLSGWASNNPTVTNRNLGAAGLNFAQFGAPSRNILTNTRGWTITDAGQTNCGEFVTYWTMFQPGAHPNQLNFNVGFTDSLQYTWIHVGGNASGSGYFTNQGAQTITGIPTNADVRLALRPQNLEHFSINNGPDRKRFYYVERWGNAVWKNMEGMFYGCSNPEFFTVSGFPNTSQVTSMKNMFRNCTNLLEVGSPWSWDVSSVTDMESMFQNCPNFNEEIDAWNVSSVTNMKSMFEGASQFTWDVSMWNVSNVTNFNSMFKNATNFNQWLNDWQTANATDMGSMFFNATQFNWDLDNWETSGVTNMSNMFRGATNFNGNITTWSTDAVTDMSGMFYGATNFNQDISGWTTSAVTNMTEMFRGATNFNQEINNWNVGNVTHFSGMFRNASAFKEDLNNWQTGSGQYFEEMFLGATLFDGEVNTWNTSNAIKMNGMFANTPLFNREIGTWNVSAVEDLNSMYQNAATFNRDLSLWDVSNAQQMNSMFDGATAFNQNLGSWQFFPGVGLDGMLDNSGMDCNNYGATLSGWLANNPNVVGINLGANNMQYGVVAEFARDVLVNTQGWSISGDNFVSTNPYVLNEGETFSAQLGCYGEFTKDNDPNERLILVDPNGNSLNLNNISVAVTNNFLTPGNPEIVPAQTSGNGYYERTDGINTFRVGRRMFKIEVPGNYTTNGGVKVRLYYDQNDFNGMVNDAPPSGGNIANYGWFKSATSDFQSTVDQMNASPSQLPLAVGLIPVYGNENGVAYVEFVVQNFSVFGMYAQTIDAPLPVTLSSFNANCQGDYITLNWTTASEFNASHYKIQSSRDGLIWNDLGQVEASGTTSQTSNYSFQTQNFGGLTYFRLVQVDLDGATENFGPISSNCELENNSMTVFPNPTADNFTVRIETTQSFENATLELVDMTGRVILSQTIDLNSGSTLLNFNGSELKAGTYFVRMKGENESFAPVRVVRL